MESPEVVELRVHGVHGTSPALMLGVGDSEITQVAGDGLTGVYRSTCPLPRRDLRDPRDPDRLLPVSVEAYSWGALTSGVQGFLGWVRRVLWLLLLPFALVNLAYWARLQVGRGTGQDRWGARAVRVSGLLLTVFMVLTPCVVAVDMVAWQCYRGSVPGCTHLPGQLDVMAVWPASQRMALACLVPLLLVAVLWYLSRQSLIRYEEVPGGQAAGTVRRLREDGSEQDEVVGPLLRSPALWSGKARTQRLQRLHLTASLATIVLFTGVHLLATSSGPDASWRFALPTLAVALLLGAAVVATCRPHPDDLEADEHERAADPRRLDVAATRLLALSTVVLVAQLLAMVVRPVALDENRDFVGHNVWIIGVFAVLTALHLVVFVGGRMSGVGARLVVASYVAVVVVVALLHATGRYHTRTAVVTGLVVLAGCAALAGWHYRLPRRRPEHAAHAWNGSGASVLLAAAAWVSLLFTSAATVAAGNYLNGPDHGVADLVSRTPQTPRVDEHRFDATGEVVLRGATLVTVGSQVFVYRGTVAVGTLSAEVLQGASTILEARGSTQVDGTSLLTVPDALVGLRDSCVINGVEETRPGGWRAFHCSAEDRHFVTAGEVTTEDRTLTLASDHTVRLVSADPPQEPLVLPQVLIWTPMAQLAWLVGVALVLVGAVWRFGRGAGAAITAGVQGVGEPPPDPAVGVTTPAVPPLVSPSYLPAVGSARRFAGLAHRSERLLDAVGVVTGPLALLILVFAATGRAPWEVAAVLRPWATLSMYAALLISLGFVALGSQIRRSESARKAVGIIWDLTTFWPRAAHPLAPPCYAERVVPELLLRTRWVLHSPSPHGGHDNQVVLSGHSQGSLIVVSAASRLSDSELSRVHLITYGSQVRGLYGRIFPRIFGPADVGYAATTGPATFADARPDVPDPSAPLPDLAAGSLARRLYAEGGGWVNLFRRTDPLGWRVFADDDAIDHVVAEVPPPGLGDPGPHVLGHSGYQHSLEYRTAVAAWTGERVVEPRLATTDLPPLPPL